MKDKRLLFILVMFLSLSLVIIKYRPVSIVSGLPPGIFWTKKLRAPASYDWVLAGDSRTYRDLSPAAMRSIAPGASILNFGFSEAGFSENYLNAAASKFSATSPRRVLVLGITPLAMTEDSFRMNDFVARGRKHDLPSASPLNIWLETQLYHFRALSGQEILHMTTGRGMNGYFQRHEADGWIASRKIPEGYNDTLDEYVLNFKKTHVTPATVSETLKVISKLTSQGVEVYAFRPPVIQALYEIEEKMSGFDEKDFVSRLAKTGGTWIPIDRTGYHSYDGSHLVETSAILLSEDLAREIQQNSRRISTLSGNQ